jgi:2-polyprenyl-3-methyl-5-hydroxy-6-metoxy-1,4-benzoquinol methylase
VKLYIYNLLRPITKKIFFSINRFRLNRDGFALGYKESEVEIFYNHVIGKAYNNFLPSRYLGISNFNYQKILFTLYAANIYAKDKGVSIIDIAESYNHELKEDIKNKAISATKKKLANIWKTDDVAIFNVFNAVKFKQEVFESVPFLNAAVLDVGCSVGAASWLAAQYGAKSFAVSDMSGSALFLAEKMLLELGKDVKVFPITDQMIVPDYGEEYYDVVMCLHVFEHTEEPVKLAQSMLRSLRQGGTFVYTYYEATVADGINTANGKLLRNKALDFISSQIDINDKFSLNPYSIGKKNIG